MNKRFAQGLSLVVALSAFSPAHALTPTLNVGCSWFSTPISTTTYNTGYLDTHASYYVAALPTAPTAGTQIIVEGTFPAVRYFSFQLSQAYAYSNLVDQISDAELYSEEGGVPNANPAVVPESHGNTDHYRIVVKFVPVPATREPNTLYAGTPVGNGFPQLVFRRYLANPGHSVLDTSDLPALTYVSPDGTLISLSQTPDSKTCGALNKLLAASESSSSANNPVPALPAVYFRPVWYVSAVPYPNADTNYLQALTSTDYGEMIVIRVMPPVTPVLPPASTVPQARYWSICQNELHNTATIACLADDEIVLGADGYASFVISPQQPPLATAALGYNWLPWGDVAEGYVPLRETLSAPGFAGSYILANEEFWLPLKTTLGAWAPQVSYCDAATFAANAATGGSALISACKAARVAQIQNKLR